LLYVNTCDWVLDEWNVYGFPYEEVLNAIDYDEPSPKWIETSVKNKLEGDFFFANSSKSTEPIINVTVQVYARNSDSDSLAVYVWDEYSYAELEVQALTPSWQWVNYTATTVLDTWAKVDGAKMNVGSKANGGPYQIDCARLLVEYDSTNYEADLEVQWTSVDYDETYEEICIKTGTFSGSEDLMVYAWNVSTSDWSFLYNLTMNSWNNVSVTDWLNSGNFTVRFLGGTESSDASQDYWDIDATLLHIWTETDYDYDYVLRVNNTVTDSWKIRLRKYSDSNIGRLQNCTIYFHNATDGTSSQLVIENGLFTNKTGPWYDLGTETIYIAMTTQANSTGTSYIYSYLEVRIPNTSTYAQYIITFEIS